MLIIQIRFKFVHFEDFFFFSLSHFHFLFKDGHTPLFLAAATGWDQIVETLLKKGANVNHKDEVLFLFLFLFLFFIDLLFTFLIKNGTTPLSAAASRGRQQIVASLLENGAVLEKVDILFCVQFIFFPLKSFFLLFLFYSRMVCTNLLKSLLEMDIKELLKFY